MPRHAIRHSSVRRETRKIPTPTSPLPFTIVYDDFNGTDETSLASRIPAVRVGVTTVWAVPQGDFHINGGKAEGRFPSSGQSVSTFDVSVADVDMRATLVFPATGTGRAAGFIFRYFGNSDRWFANLSLDAGTMKISEVTAGVTTTRATLTGLTLAANTAYSLRLTLVGDVITFIVSGVGQITYTSAVGDTRTKHGLIANGAIGAAPMVFEDFYILQPPPAADVLATISGTSSGTFVSKTAMVIVDNNLRTDFTGATTQKNLALSNLNGKYNHLAMFIEDFGNGRTILDTWSGVGDTIADLPTVNTAPFKAHWTIIENGINPDSWGIYCWRLPWQFTGVTNSSQVTTKSTSATYSQEGRRLLTDKSAQFIEWVAQWSADLMGSSAKIRTFYLGSECKGYQVVVPVTVGGTVIRAAKSHAWDYDNYAGTAGRADMGFENFLMLMRQGLIQGANRAGVPYNQVRIVSPYTVTAHFGTATSNSTDGLHTDTLTDSAGNVLDTSDMNGSNVTKGGWGWPNAPAVMLMAEMVRQIVAAGITTAEWELGSDFGTFNTDNLVTVPAISDHDLAYRRPKGHFAFYKKMVEKYGLVWDNVVKRLPECYAKAQYRMDLADSHAISIDLRDDYQASIRAAFLIACYEDGIQYPVQWSPFGRGDQPTPVDLGTDPPDDNEWYGGCVVRTVTDNNNHPGTAVTGGGAAQAALALFAGLKAHFPSGTAKYPISFSSTATVVEFRGIASGTWAMLVNQSNATKTLAINGQVPITFAPYEIKFVTY